MNYYILSEITCGKCNCKYWSTHNGCPQCGHGTKTIVITGTSNPPGYVQIKANDPFSF